MGIHSCHVLLIEGEFTDIVVADGIAQRFICAAGGFVAAPSANTSGRPSPTLAQYVKEDMDGRIEMILDGGEEVGIGLESTIVDLTGDIPMILRPGYVTQKMLEEVAYNRREVICS